MKVLAIGFDPNVDELMVEFAVPADQAPDQAIGFDTPVFELVGNGWRSSPLTLRDMLRIAAGLVQFLAPEASAAEIAQVSRGVPSRIADFNDEEEE